MNRIRYSGRCLVGGEQIAVPSRGLTDEQHAAMVRQMACGICDACQRKRYEAALDYIRALDGMRAVLELFEQHREFAPDRATRGPVLVMGMRVVEAEARCVALKMWSKTPSPPPERFRNRERNTA